jgi:hypothetical protein
MRIRVLIMRIRVLIMRMRVLVMRIRLLIVRLRVLVTALSAQISKRKEDISGSNAILVLLHGQVAPSCSMPPAATCNMLPRDAAMPINTCAQDARRSTPERP